MKITIKLSDPKALPVTVNFISTIEELTTLYEQLPKSWPAYELRGALYDAIHAANKTFYGEGKVEEK